MKNELEISVLIINKSHFIDVWKIYAKILKDKYEN